MPVKNTVVLFVHGANRAEKDEKKNTKTWKESFNVTEHYKAMFQLVSGNDNIEINSYHEAKHQGRDFPQYVGWTAPWYGDIWAGIATQSEPFSERLNEYDEAKDDSTSLVEKIERKAMQKHFDELVPFYELAVIKNDGRTLYEAICQKFLDQPIQATADDRCYGLVAHSMGCAVSYNVMSHISYAQKNIDYCPIVGTLSTEYRQAVAKFAASPAKCFGFMTFGNYTRYNWCQRLNNKILFGEYKEQYVYPSAVGRWFNFWTVLGGDPYILDDQLGDDIVNEAEGEYDNVVVWRTPGSKIGHGRTTWFRRSQFSKKLRKKMFRHLYL